MNRPKLDEHIAVDDFIYYYWLKEELVSFCKARSIDDTGGKTAIADRIKIFLATGELIKRPPKSQQKAASGFDWHNASLSLDTILTSSFTSTPNVRRFLAAQIGSHFRFTVDLMQWCKANTGQTLEQAITAWITQHRLKKTKTDVSD